MADKPELHRCHAWQRRILTDGVGVPLGFYGELWADQQHHPAREGLQRLATRLGHDEFSPYYLTRTLLHDLLHAACGVELHVERVVSALDESQRDQDVRAKERPELYAWQPGIESQHAPIKESLAWDYPNLLTWVRTVEERVDRRVPGASVRIGLLPAIGEPELRSDVEHLLAAFKDRVGDERRLTNYGLHAAKLPDPSTPSGVLQEDGTIFVPIPDPPAEPVYLFDLFTYHQGRDLRSFATEALDATEEFIDGVLDAFAGANERIKRTRGD